MSPQSTPPEFDYRRFGILYVDDEINSLRMFEAAFGQTFRVFTAANAEEGFRLLEEKHDELGVLMTDQRMPGEKGVQLLEKARHQYPRILRILTTAYSEMDTAIAAVNSGAIYKYITKPWDPVDLEQVLRHALQFFLVQRERDQLLHEKITTLRRLMYADRLLGMELLSAGLNHHLRNSLVAVRTFLDLAPVKLAEEKISPETLRDPQYWREFHAMAQAQIQRITSILDNLGLASSGTPEAPAETVDVPALLEAALQEARPKAQAKAIEIQMLVAAPVSPIQGHPGNIQHLFELLLEDELQLLSKGGRMVWRIGPPPKGQGVWVVLEDNGPGLNADDLRFLFDPFYSRSNHPQDLGLNLMACFFLAHHEAGSIQVSPRPEGGTRFEIHLPGLSAEMQQMKQPTSEVSWSLYEELWEDLISGRAEK